MIRQKSDRRLNSNTADLEKKMLNHLIRIYSETSLPAQNHKLDIQRIFNSIIDMFPYINTTSLKEELRYKLDWDDSFYFLIMGDENSWKVVHIDEYNNQTTCFFVEQDIPHIRNVRFSKLFFNIK